MLASELLGRRARRPDGTDLGRIVDIHGRVEVDGSITITSVVVSGRPHLRLFGYERPEIRGPWLIAALARALQGTLREVPIDQIIG